MTQVRSIEEFLQALATLQFVGKRHSHVRVWFRGQPEAGLALRPAVYRPHFPAKSEEERMELERHLSQDFRVESAGLLTGRETSAELYFIQQHYRLPTRLLDWTHNPLASLYFAIDKRSVDGEVFVMDAYQMETPGFRNFGVPTSRHPICRKTIERIVHWTNEYSFPEFIIPLRPDHFDRRIAYQHGCFTFHVPKKPILTSQENPTLHSFVIPDAAKKPSRHNFLFLVSMSSVYTETSKVSQSGLRLLTTLSRLFPIQIWRKDEPKSGPISNR